VLGVIRWSKTAENSTDYSLNNTVRAMLYLPTTREQKYKARQVSDALFSRAGDALHALTVFVVVGLLSIGTTGFALINVGLAVVFLAVAIAVGRSYKELVASGKPPMPKSSRTGGGFEPGATI
jgi:AAA family ATP:ADP antiporter